MNRREFFKRVAVAGGVLVLFRGKVYAFGQTGVTLLKFQDSLPGLGPGGASKVLGNYIPIATATSLEIEMVQFQHQFHPGLLPTYVWGYRDKGGGQPAKYLGPVIVATKDIPTDIVFSNALPDLHVLRMNDENRPGFASATDSVVDKTLMGAEPSQKENRTVPHLHGGFVPWQSDGGPYSWWTDEAPLNRSEDTGGEGLNHEYGKDFVSRHIVYPNNMYSRLAWYHDHALGITRLNAYAGIAAGYVITDSIEQNLINGTNGVPKLLPDLGIPLVIQDKTFRADGSLWYPQVYEANSDASTLGRWDRWPGRTKLPTPSCIPEFYSDTPVINGAAYPYVEVPATRVRFRMLNGSQARVYNLGIYPEPGSGNDWSGEADLAGMPGGLPMVQIGTEGGFLPKAAILKHAPVKVNSLGVPTTYGLLLAGAERADVLVNFSGMAGKRFIFYNDAPAPFPGFDSSSPAILGEPRNDYFTGDPDQSLNGGAPPTEAHKGPNTRTLMEIRVVAPNGSPDSRSDAQFVADFNTQITKAMASTFVIPRSTFVRDLTLNEDFDEFGRLIQMLGTTTVSGLGADGTPMFGRAFDEAITEIVAAGSTETWRIFNTTGDTHPIHFHLTNAKVISRAPFTYVAANKLIPTIGPSRGPDPNETGWKETVRMNPGEVTTVQLNFALPKTDFWGQTNEHTSPPNTRTQTSGGYYHTYVWHCHILEHEEHDMMRELWVGPVPLT
jgi:spore coat protein A